MLSVNKKQFKIIPKHSPALDSSPNIIKRGRSYGMEAIMETDSSTEDPGGGILEMGEDYPKIKDTTELGGGIWIILFGMVIVISLAANLLLSVLVVKNRKKHNLVYLMHLFLFAINLVDFSLLIFEFSLGIEHEYPYSQSACTVYQAVAKGNPIIQASAIVVMLLYTAKTYTTTQNLPTTTQQPSESAAQQCSDRDKKVFSLQPKNGGLLNSKDDDQVTIELQNLRSSHHHHGSVYRRNRDFIKFVCVVVFLVVIELILSVPTALFASIVNVKNNRYCEIDLLSSSLLSKNSNDIDDPSGSGYFYSANLHQIILCLYYLIYSSILTFWLPLMISIFPAIRLIRDKHRDKYPEVSVVLGTVSSFFMFYLFHATLVFGRHFYDLLGNGISTYNLWMIKVGQSLLLLIAYFWNFIRPALALSLDPDLKIDLLNLLHMRGYGALPRELVDSQSRRNTRQPQDTIVPYSQEIERRNRGKWEIISGVKHVFTKTILGQQQKRTDLKTEERNSFLIVSLAEIEIPALIEQGKTPHTSTLNSSGDEDKYSIRDENSSSLSTETTENIGESNNY